MRKLLFITGSRGEYGYIRPILKNIQTRSDADFDVVATNMHLSQTFGSTITEFQQDDIPVKYKIYNTLDSYNEISSIKSLGLFLLQIPDVIEDSKPDIIVISGDRGEQFMAAVAGLHLDIPVAHIQAGEISGHVDGTIRHAITKLSTLHFAANENAFRRVLRLGEEDRRVFRVGAPLVDELLEEERDPGILARFGFSEVDRLFLVINHPVQEERAVAENTKILIETLMELPLFVEGRLGLVVIQPNSDSNSLDIRSSYRALALEEHRNIHLASSLPRREYLDFLAACDLVVGNSSSGILEASTFKKPVLNVGRRQRGRMASRNVIHVEDYSKALLNQAIEEALSPQFLAK